MSEAQELREGDSCEGHASLLISVYIPAKQVPDLSEEVMEVDDDNEVTSPSGVQSRPIHRKVLMTLYR